MTRAQIEFRAQYTKILRLGFAGALFLHGVAFGVWPDYVPQVYQLREKEIKVVELPPEIKVPPPPQEIRQKSFSVQGLPFRERQWKMKWKEVMKSLSPITP